MKPLRLLLAGVFLALCAGAISAHAALVLYTDRTAWRIAAGGGTGNIQDNLNSGNATRTGYTLGGNALSFPSSDSDTTVNGSIHARFNLEDGTIGLFTFTTAVTALGYDFNPHPFDINLSVDVAINGVPSGSSYQLPANDEDTVFIGFVSDSPFTTFGISAQNDFAYHGVDNLEAFTVVPEPSTYFAAGFLALAAGYHFVRSRRA